MAIKMDVKYFGRRMARARKRNHLTQKELAKRIYTSLTTVSRYERGLSMPDMPMLIKLANELDVSVDYLLGV